MAEMVAYWLPKDGTPAAEWEDGVAYSRQSGWFAVADGASTGNSSREWAYTLASTFVADRSAQALHDDSSQSFLDWVDTARARFDPKSPEFPVSRMPEWVQAAGDRMGAHATFIGGRLDDGHVRAVAVGDCCLFHLHAASGRTTAFPLSEPGQFNSNPRLLSSLGDRDHQLADAVRHYRAPFAPGDVVFAASDAFAEWLTKGIDDPDVWKALSGIGNKGFRRLCQDLRMSRRMKNDDVTLWRASVPERSKR